MRLAKVMFLRLRARAQTFEELAAWIRKRCPHVLPDAIGVVLLQLKNRGLVACHKQRWKACHWPTLYLPRHR